MACPHRQTSLLSEAVVLSRLAPTLSNPSALVARKQPKQLASSDLLNNLCISMSGAWQWMGYDVLRTVSSNLVKSSLILEKRMPQSLRTGSYVPYFRFDHFRVKETHGVQSYHTVASSAGAWSFLLSDSSEQYEGIVAISPFPVGCGPHGPPTSPVSLLSTSR